MSEYLPQEVLTEIFLKLPTRSIIQCTSVCKPWYSLITSPHFISVHLNHNQDDYLLVRHCSLITGEREETRAKENYALYRDNDSFDYCAQIDFPFVCPSCFNIIGSCNGLLCLSDDLGCYNNLYYLWNPYIRKSVQLPESIFTFWTYGPFEHTLGFGFDPVGNDFKVVRIVHIDDKVQEPPYVELYKLSTGVWQDISHVAPSRKFYPQIPGVYVNGACHWVVCHWAASHLYCSRNMIVLFDVHKEMFREMMLPDCLVDEFYSYRGDGFVLFVSCDSLCFASTPYKDSRKTIELWVMKEYGNPTSWVKQFSVNLLHAAFNIGVVDDLYPLHHPVNAPLFLRKPIASRKNGEIFWRADDGFLVSYDPVAAKIKNLGICNTKVVAFHDELYVGTYKKSLVLLGKQANSRAGNIYEESSNLCKRKPKGGLHDKKRKRKKGARSLLIRQAAKFVLASYAERRVMARKERKRRRGSESR